MTILSPLTEKESIFIALRNSTVVLLVLVLIALDLSCRYLKPLHFITNKNYRPIEFDPWVSKFPPYLYSKSRPDVLVVGSSLPMAAFSLADKAFVERRNIDNSASMCTYTKADEFQKRMQESLGEPIRVENFSCAGGMVSDTYIFLKRLIDEGRIPRLVFYGISPRDFVDNMMPPLGQSPLFEVISDWSIDMPKHGMSLNEYLGAVCSNYSYYYKTRRKHKGVITAMTADALGRPVSLFTSSAKKTEQPCQSLKPASASEKVEPELSQSGDPLTLDLERYEKRYNPLNIKRFTNEAEYFKKLVSLCEKHHIRLILVGMPLTEQNRQLMPPQLLDLYSSTIATIQGNYQVKWIDLATSQSFQQNDFSDSAHLNSEGSKKFQKLLLDRLTAESVWQAVR